MGLGIVHCFFKSTSVFFFKWVRNDRIRLLNFFYGGKGGRGDRVT